VLLLLLLLCLITSCCICVCLDQHRITNALKSSKSWDLTTSIDGFVRSKIFWLAYVLLYDRWYKANWPGFLPQCGSSSAPGYWYRSEQPLRYSQYCNPVHTLFAEVKFQVFCSVSARLFLRERAHWLAFFLFLACKRFISLPETLLLSLSLAISASFLRSILFFFVSFYHSCTLPLSCSCLTHKLRIFPLSLIFPLRIVWTCR